MNSTLPAPSVNSVVAELRRRCAGTMPHAWVRSEYVQILLDAYVQQTKELDAANVAVGILELVASTQMSLAVCDADIGRAVFGRADPDEETPTQEERERLADDADDAIATAMSWAEAAFANRHPWHFELAISLDEGRR